MVEALGADIHRLNERWRTMRLHPYYKTIYQRSGVGQFLVPLIYIPFFPRTESSSRTLSRARLSNSTLPRVFRLKAE
jgi:hypothetical protein